MFEEEQKSQADFVIGCEAALKVLPAYLTQYFSSAERCLEDHELVVQVESTMASESKFLFRKNYAKYEFFKNPTVSLVSLSLGFGTLEILQFILEFHSSGSQNN